MKFTYVKLGIARIIDEDDVSHPIEGCYIWGVRIRTDAGPGRVLGLVQNHPTLTNQWHAVASLGGDTFPAVDFNKGLWQMTPGCSGFGSKREASVWLKGASDARQPWFTQEW